jgi:hypothetical protein
LEVYKAMQRHSFFSTLLMLCFALTLLAACSDLSGVKGQDNTLSTPSPVASMPTRVPSPSVAVQPKVVLSSLFILYQGDGYSIGYPKAWKVIKSVNAITFSDSAGVTEFVVQMAPNPKGVLLPEKAVERSLTGMQKGAKNYKKLNIPATTTLNGVTWFEGGASIDTQASGRLLRSTVVTMATNHPMQDESTTLFSFVYTCPTRNFETLNRTIFQPMLQSFRFA